MDIEQIRAFLVINETRNFTKVAEILHIAQSTITARIRTLEQQIGKQLLLRNNKQVTLTRAGELFVPYAERMNELVQISMETILLEDRFTDKLVIGGPSSIWNYKFHTEILNFKSSHPEIALDLMAHTNENTIQKVIDGTIDIGIVYSRPRHPMVDYELLQEDHFVLAGRKDFEMINLNSLRGGDFLFIDWGKPFMTWFNEIVGPYFIPAFKINQTALVVNYLKNGDYFGFVPKSFVAPHLEDGGLQELDHKFSSKLPSFKTYVIYLKNKMNRSASDLFLERLRK
ncbi:LysR family transcriptional regulator [Sporosarcina sp. 179-K 8C2 HS]|uniref:LysR family transcriptional regulator n=1 Tax=Sporosarcina sp. 179-K 8C2 HS TaxID=3142387 RepID=UPI0039A063F1